MNRYFKVGLAAIILVLASTATVWAAWGKIGPDVRITNAPFESSEPSLVWTGTEYGVSWGDFRDDLDGICSTTFGTMDCNCEIYFARLDSSGAKIGADVRITNDSSNSGASSLVWTGTEYGVSWQDDRDGNYEIYFARIDSFGNKIGGDVRITNDPAISLVPSLVGTGTGYGVSWEDSRDGNGEIYFARIDSSGNKIGADVRVTNDPSNSEAPSLVWTGTEYGLSWFDMRDGNNEIYFARIDSSGAKIGADVRITNAPSNSVYPSLVWTGTEYGVCWNDSRDGNGEIYFARIDSSGAKIGGDVRITNAPSDSWWPSLVWTGTEYGVSWTDNRDGNYEIYFARIDSSGNKIGADVRISNDPSISWFSSLVWTGTEYGVSWDDDRDGNQELYFARIFDPNLLIPTLSEWGLIIMVALLLLALAWFVRRNVRLTGSASRRM